MDDQHHLVPHDELRFQSPIQSYCGCRNGVGRADRPKSSRDSGRVLLAFRASQPHRPAKRRGATAAAAPHCRADPQSIRKSGDTHSSGYVFARWKTNAVEPFGPVTQATEEMSRRLARLSGSRTPRPSQFLVTRTNRPHIRLDRQVQRRSKKPLDCDDGPRRAYDREGGPE